MNTDIWLDGEDTLGTFQRFAGVSHAVVTPPASENFSMELVDV